MSRLFYCWLLWLHPPAFRRRFAGEMMWIYDECADSAGALSLWVDGFLSLLRQWVLRSGSWKVVAAMSGAVLEITAGGLGWCFYGPAQITEHVTASQFSGRWTGALKAGERVVPVSLVIKRETGRWTGELDTLTPDPARAGGVRGLKFTAQSVNFYVSSHSAVLSVAAKLTDGNLVGSYELTNPVERGVLQLTHEEAAATAGSPPALMDAMIRLIVFAVGPIIVMVIGLALWFKSFTGRRIAAA